LRMTVTTSLTALITTHPKRADVRARLDQFIPEYSRRVHVARRVSRSYRDPTLVGVAFDYAVRMELTHRAPAAIRGLWVAEGAVALLQGSARRKAARLVGEARALEKSLPADTSLRYEALAAHASRLATLDVVLRSQGREPPQDLTDDQCASVAAEVRELLEVATELWALSAATPLALNPVLGGGAVGADADLIAGSLLIDIKTNRDALIERDVMRQVVGYACLAACTLRQPYLLVDRVGIYLARHGVLQTFQLLGGAEDRAETGLFLMETGSAQKVAFEDPQEALRHAIAALGAMSAKKGATKQPARPRRPARG
jgi:hypothetical protein